MAFGEFNDLPRRTASDKILCDKAYNVAKNQKMMDVKEVVLHWSTHFKSEIMTNQQLQKNYTNQSLEHLQKL